MKTLRFIGMAIVAIIMSVNFVACSDDDDDNPIVGTWRSEVDNYGYSDSYTFNADGSGIWQEFKGDKQTDSESFKYSVDGDKITFTWTESVLLPFTFTLIVVNTLRLTAIVLLNVWVAPLARSQIKCIVSSSM